MKTQYIITLCAKGEYLTSLINGSWNTTPFPQMATRYSKKEAFNFDDSKWNSPYLIEELTLIDLNESEQFELSKLTSKAGYWSLKDFGNTFDWNLTLTEALEQLGYEVENASQSL